MKIFLGIVSVLVALAAAILGILAIWGIYPVSLDIIIKVLVTLTVFIVALLLLWLLFVFFFKKEKYRNTGNKAHPID